MSYSKRPVILDADDDPEDRELLKSTLQEKGVQHEIVETANGREALLFLRSSKSLQNPPVLILLDLNMPILNGRETLAIIKSESETDNIPVVVFTTSSSPHDEAFCKRFEVEMITKPETTEQLERVAERLMKYVG